MLSRSDQLKFLANDVTILDTLFGNKEGEVLTIPAKYMPDNKSYSISLAGVKEITGELRKQMVDTVRSQWNARDKDQNAEKNSPKEASRTSDDGGDTEARVSGGAGVAAPPLASDAEKSLEWVLRERAKVLEETLEYAIAQYTEAQAFLADTEEKLNEVITCIDALQTGSQKSSTTSRPNTDSTS